MSCETATMPCDLRGRPQGFAIGKAPDGWLRTGTISSVFSVLRPEEQELASRLLAFQSLELALRCPFASMCSVASIACTTGAVFTGF